MSALSTYQDRIHQIAPELSIDSISLNNDGLLNDVVIVNDELVFRFPKSDYAKNHLRNEARILRLLQNYISLPIPNPLYETDDCIAYQLIRGKTLRRDILMKFSDADIQAIADQLAQFLRELHHVPSQGLEIPLADALMKYEGWVNVYARIREKVLPLLMPHLRDWLTEHFENHLADPHNFEYELRVVDTDIPPYHILHDNYAKRISGIIDFGCAGLGDPAIDFGVIMYNYGESFLDRFYRVYPETQMYLRRARFYAGAHEARWLLTGIERNDLSWFAVHIGSAKDSK